jgi:hypothetical protein
LEPISAHPRWGKFAAAFFKVYLLGQDPSGQFRDVIYGDASNSLCNSTNANYKMAACLLER